MVFPGQGTQVPGMGAPWQDHPAWKVLEQAERALGEPLRVARARRARRAARPHTRRATRRALHVARRVGSAATARRTTSLRSPATRSARSPRWSHPARSISTTACGSRPVAPSSRSARPTSIPGRMAALLGATVEQATEACAAAPDALLDRQRQRAGPGRDRRHARRASTPRSRARRRSACAARRRSTSAARSTHR